MSHKSMYALIERKKQGRALDASAWKWIVNGYTDGSIPAYQMAALLMAIWFQGMDSDETWSLTETMMNSGPCLDFSNLTVPTVDKHSTGGVGDKVSLALAPLVASCGAAVPMVSGRGLGHTGGTLDKLGSIPGFRILLSNSEFMNQVKTIGCAMTGQSDEMAPADGKIYALRDVTATVDCIPLIAASIMSKKLAAGPSSLVFDVKVGCGAFMRTMDMAEELATSLIKIGNQAGREVTALITSMDQPLGFAVGNALEVHEIIQLLQGKGPRDLVDVTTGLATEMLILAGVHDEPGAADVSVMNALSEGLALQRFQTMIESQGGDPRIIDDPELLPKAPFRTILRAQRSGYIEHLDARVFGDVAVSLGAGRRTVDSEIDPSVGFVLRAKVGARIDKDDAVVEIHAQDEEMAHAAAQALTHGIRIVPEFVDHPAIILKRVHRHGTSPWWFSQESDAS